MRFFEYIYTIRDFFEALIVPNLWWLRILSVVISILLFVGIIYILIRVNYLNIKAEEFINILGAAKLPKRRALRGWKQIQLRLASQDSQQWKIAILEADKILDEILKMSGYLGSIDNKLALITSAQLSNIEEIKTVHRIREQIGQDPTYEISQESAAQALEIYKKAFIELNLIQE